LFVCCQVVAELMLWPTTAAVTPVPASIEARGLREGTELVSWLAVLVAVLPTVVTVLPTVTMTGASGSDPDVVGGVGEPPVPVPVPVPLPDPPPVDVLVPVVVLVPLTGGVVTTVTLVPAGTSTVTGGGDPVRVTAATVAKVGAPLVPPAPTIGAEEPWIGELEDGLVGPTELCGDPVLVPLPCADTSWCPPGWPPPEARPATTSAAAATPLTAAIARCCRLPLGTAAAATPSAAAAAAAKCGSSDGRARR
jgi:hypothetical protein